MRFNFGTLTTLIWLSFLIIMGALSALVYIQYQAVEPEPKYDSYGFCGVGSNIPAHKFKAMEIGRIIFKEKCAMCHNMDMKSDMTGPALGGFMNRWNGDTLAFAVYLSQPLSFLASTENKYILQMDKRFAPAVKNSFSFSYLEVKALVEYIETNSSR